MHGCDLCPLDSHRHASLHVFFFGPHTPAYTKLVHNALKLYIREKYICCIRIMVQKNKKQLTQTQRAFDETWDDHTCFFIV